MKYFLLGIVKLILYAPVVLPCLLYVGVWSLGMGRWPKDHEMPKLLSMINWFIND